ncbi:ADP-ribosylglycohydrolase family protein [Paludibacterium paludis]|nr:ADP-ribosylglycohydrolase family protein [Paludibacterium paludis]
MTEAVRLRGRGALLGLALGDALGGPLVLSRRDSAPALTDMTGGGPLGLAAGEWSDDTAMALCLGYSLVDCRGMDPLDQLQRYLRWRNEGYCSASGRCVDIGLMVNAALERFSKNPQPYPGLTREDTAGNGSLMRLAPVALFFHPDKYPDPAHAMRAAVDASRTTHGETRCVDACRVLAWMLHRALSGDGREGVFDSRSLLAACPDLHPDILAVAGGSYRHKRREDIRSTAFVVDSLEAALWSLWESGSFREGALLAANLAGEADTVAAIYGQLAGALYSESGLPADWLARLAWRDKISRLADDLYFVG